MSQYNSYNPLVGDFVFEDLDLDGIQDSNEPGIANVEVKLIDGYDNSVLETTFTDSNGKYSFQVNPHNSGGYKIMFNNPDDSVYMFSPRQVGDNPEIDSDGPMSDVFHLDPFEPNDTIDAGLIRKTPQPIAGIDIEKATNGQDADSPTGPKIPVGDTATFTYVVTNTGNVALSGVEVIDDAGTPNQTGDDFNPHFTGGDSNNNDRLDPNETWTYEASRTVTEGQYTNKGKVTAHDPDGDTVMDMDPSNHFGEPPETAGLGDFVFEDLDEDGIQDNNEPGISGATVKLQNSNGQTLDTTTTDGSGFYQFTSLTPGDYKVMFTQPSGFSGVSPFQVGNNSAIDSDADPNNGLMSDVVTLAGGEFNDTIDAGFFKPIQPQPAKLGDFVFNDLDQDGIQDSNEPGIAGVTVKLQNPSGTTLSTTTTDGNGMYMFGGLTPGDYKVMFTQPTGFSGVSPFQAGNNSAVDSDADPNNGLMSDVVSLSSGEVNNTIDAGFFKPVEPAKLGDFVFEDLDQDGIQDSNEPGIAGVTVKLQNPSGTTLSTTTTDGNGMYMFGGLAPGDYKVMFTQPSGFNSVSPFQAGGNSAVDSDANPNNGLMSDVVNLSSGEFDSTIDAGFFNAPPPTAGLGDFVFEDLDQDGIQDSNEPGIPGAEVKLQSSGGTTLDTTTTNANGFYEFTGLTPGDYKVMFTQPSGFDGVSPFFAGGNRAIDSDANPNNGLMSPVVNLSAGEFDSTIDAGFFKPALPAKLGDFVFNDIDQDGIQDSNEPGIAGAEVKLQDPNGTTLATTTTDNSGMYMFGGLTPGDYKVMFTQPSGFDGVSPFQAGNNSAVDSDANPNNGLMSPVVTLGSGENNNTIDAGFFQSVNPAIDIEKLVAVLPPGGGFVGQDVCDEVGKPEALTFIYEPGLSIDTNQKSDQVKFKETTASIDERYDEVFIKTNKGFEGTVSIGDELTVFASGGDLSFEIYDFRGGGLLQDIEKYHLSCSQPITLGDDLGSFILSEYQGENGSASIPNPVFVDADSAPGPEALIGTVVDFRYEVINTGDTPLNNIIVTDNRLSNLSFDGGDNNNNNQLDLDETWIYSASETATEGLQTNKGTVTAVDSVTGQDLMAMDPANYTGIEQPAPQGDVCDTLGKPREIMFEYNPGTDVLTGQKSDKARINFNGGVDDDGTSFIIVTDEDKANEALQGKGKQFFTGNVSFGEEFTADVDLAGEDKFGSKTFIHFFDNQSGGLLQSIEYHTSCSQPIQLGDIIGNVELVGYVGEDGSFI